MPERHLDTQINPLEIARMVAEKTWPRLRTTLKPLSPEDVAPLLETLEKPERVLAFRCLERQQAADTFSFLDDEHQESLLTELTDQETRDILAHMSPDDRTFLLEETPAEVTQKLLNLLSHDDRKEALTLLGYPEDSVGRLMSPDFASVDPNMSIQEAMAAIKRQAPDSETLNMIYVIDRHGRLVDDIRLRRFISAPETAKVSDIMDGQFSALSAYDSQELAVQLMSKKGHFALPVTDSNGVLLGVVTADDVLDVAVEEATDDIHRSGAVQPLDEPYLRSSLSSLYLRRIPWLVLLIFVNLISGEAIQRYEGLIESVVALVIFLPLLIGSGGNAGAQASTLVVRSMALGEVRMLDYLRCLWREMRVAIMLSLTMALTVFFIAWWRVGRDVANVVGISMISIVIIGSLLGMTLPFILKFFRQDPATASSPLVTSVADILGVLIYLAIAAHMLDLTTVAES
ncbi:MAG: magnesium transporter [Verrucomicrobiales bacterium]